MFWASSCELFAELRRVPFGRKDQLCPTFLRTSAAGNFWRAAMTRQLFCRVGQRVIFGDQLIMRRKPADDLVSGGLFGNHEAAPTTRNDFKAELVAREAGGVMRQHWPGLARAPGAARDLPRPGAYSTRLFEFQFLLNAMLRRPLTNHHPTMVVILAHIFLCSDWNLGPCISLE
jgi:hypothetical protein